MLELNKIINADVFAGLRTLPDNSIDCCVTSPPYYALRDYGTATWVGGNNPDCRHRRESHNTGHYKNFDEMGAVSDAIQKQVCVYCGAVRQDLQIGLEQTPEKYIEKMCDVFMEVFKVLKPSGTLWLNIGDSYAGSGKGKGHKPDENSNHLQPKASWIEPITAKLDGYKPKDMIGIPFMLAFALRSKGWYLRQDIIWHKPNPMPESTKDRCVKSHEYIFLMSKSPKYYFNHKAILTPIADGTHDNNFARENLKYSDDNNVNQWVRGSAKRIFNYLPDGQPAAMKRSVWSVPTKAEPEHHFACFPQKLITDCILAGCPENGIVLDPFFGSGTTGVVARKLNRNFIGIELNPKYCVIAERKLRRELGMFD